MEWNKDKSITLSKGCILLFSVILLAMDATGIRLVRLFSYFRELERGTTAVLYLTFYSCSIFGWIVLWKMWKLLSSLQSAQVFTEENVRILRTVSWCCAAVAFICLAASLSYLPFIVVSAAAAFMSLIVRIVKNCFQQAVSMKDELDLTV